MPQIRNATFQNFACMMFFLLLLFVRTCFAASASPAIPVPMQAERWLTTDNATFTADSFAPGGVLNVSKGSVAVKDLVFADGTIAFDLFMPEHGIFGVRLRAPDRENGEALYFRPQKDCANAPDCLQYMPLDHGAFEWDLFPETQTAAPIHTLRWNHVRLAVTGRTMLVYLNHARAPTLRVAHMEGNALTGRLLFGGPAKYANLVITPTPPSPAPAREAAAAPDGFLRHWQLSTASLLPSTHDPVLDVPTGVQPAYASMPPEGAAWKTASAQAKGLVNFSQEIGSAKDASAISLAWAKTTVVSDRAQVKTVQIGFVREIWVYVNGTLVFSGRNLYGLPAAAVADGRISLENGTFQLPLIKGNNEIAIALNDNLPGNLQHFGWGMQVKLSDHGYGNGRDSAGPTGVAASR